MAMKAQQRKRRIECGSDVADITTKRDPTVNILTRRRSRVGRWLKSTLFKNRHNLPPLSQREGQIRSQPKNWVLKFFAASNLSAKSILRQTVCRIRTPFLQVCPKKRLCRFFFLAKFSNLVTIFGVGRVRSSGSFAIRSRFQRWRRRS